MVQPVDAFGLLGAGVGVAVLGLVRYGLTNRDQFGATGFVVAMVGVVGWSFAYAVALLGEQYVSPLAAYNVIMLAAEILGIGWLLMALEYTRHYIPSRRRVAALFVVPVLTQVAVWTNDWHELFWAPGTTVLAGGGVERVYGPLFMVHTAYAYGLIFVGMGLLAVHLFNTHHIYRQQALAIILAGTIPLSLDVVHVWTSALGPRIDLTPIGFGIGGLIAAWGLFRYQFLEIGPLARRAAVDEMDDPVITVDGGGRLVDVNDTAKAMLGANGDVLGERLGAHWAELAAVIDDASTRADRPVVAFERGETTAYYEPSVSTVPFQSQGRGRVIVARDVTERRRRKRRLEAKNQRLEQFAAIVNHDLQTPLDAANRALELGRTSGDETDLGLARDAVQRASDISHGLLQLARSGESEYERRVDLATVARRAWEQTDAPAADLDVRSTTVVRANESWLQELFENLFRNCVAHGRPDAEAGADPRPITVSVGLLEDAGFYVADDGVGFPADEREGLFRPQYTSSEETSGIGLWIVSRIADAHGWAVEATESGSGGARIEVSNVSIAEDRQSVAAQD